MVQSALEGVKKPDAAIYQRTLDRLGVRAEEAVFLDDIGSNVKKAAEMGMKTVKVRVGHIWGWGEGWGIYGGGGELRHRKCSVLGD